MKKRHIAWVLVSAAFLLTVVVLVIQASGGPFDGSTVTATDAKVSVGDTVGFALYVVNAGPVTATEVLVWNPLPTGTTYISASGGAFPVVGGAVSEAALTKPLAGRAYDARLGVSVPLTDPGQVTGIVWMGDLPPGGAATPGLAVQVELPARRDLVDEMFIYDDGELAGRFSDQTWVQPLRNYQPLILQNFPPTPTPGPTITTTTVFTIPYGSGMRIGCGSWDPDYQRALSGDGSGKICDDTMVDLGQYAPDGPYLPNYRIKRFYAGWDTSSLPDDAEIVSATLTLDVICSPPDPAFNAIVYRGVWTPPLDETDWYATGEQVIGRWDTSDFPCSWELGRKEPVFISLDPTAINPTGTTLVEIRSDREGTPPIASDYQVVMISFYPHYVRLTVTYREVLP